jgi:hypothetical protein
MARYVLGICLLLIHFAITAALPVAGPPVAGPSGAGPSGAAISIAAPFIGAPSVEEFTKDFELRQGFLNLYIDHKQGRSFLEIPHNLGELIYQESLARGIGSNDIGMDRGRLGDTQLVEFVKVGNKVLLQAKNTAYRADSENPLEQRAVAEAFATSVLWGFKVSAQGDASYLIDYTKFLLSDSFGLGAVLKKQKEGEFKVSPERSAMYFALTKSFPNNTELEAMLTLTGKEAGEELGSVTPDKTAVTVHVHHSLIALPEPGYKMRRYRPESGYFPVSYADFSAPVEADLMQRFIRRHRLVKQDPSAEKSRAVKPIVYYMDPAVPEPVRSALFEGAIWWNQAFEAAGYIDAFQLKYLPEDADPMDVRYNVIQWVHRRTRGWSYGMSVQDPRTGEILKGKVTLGSLRIRQDILIAQGLLSPFKSGVSEEDASKKLKALALARIRQLSAHEIGHTLGLVHNFSASTYSAPNERGSVMDYPHPMLRLTQGKLDLSSAYAEGIGPWDKHAITYGYADAPKDQESGFLEHLIEQARAQGMRLMTDADARVAGGGHPNAHLWDSGQNIISGLDNTIQVRDIALSGLGENSLRKGQPFSDLGKVLVPIYFLHRYQTEAVIKLIGGASYEYGVKGQQFLPVEPLSDSLQREALGVVLQTLTPDFLVLSESLTSMIPPSPAGYGRSRESAPSQVLPYFDPVTIAEAAAEETLKFLFNSKRLARISQQSALDPNQLSVAELINELLAVTFRDDHSVGLQTQIGKRIKFLVVENLLMIAWGDEQIPEVQAVALVQLRKVEKKLSRSKNEVDQYLAGLIEKAEQDREFNRRKDVAKIPPGSPI